MTREMATKLEKERKKGIKAKEGTNTGSNEPVGVE